MNGARLVVKPPPRLYLRCNLRYRASALFVLERGRGSQYCSLDWIAVCAEPVNDELASLQLVCDSALHQFPVDNGYLKHAPNMFLV